MACVYLSLGSNIENRITHLTNAIKGIKNFLDIDKISPIYKSDSWNFKGNFFYNLCISAHTKLPPQSLIKYLLDVEKKLGRERSEKNGYTNRIIDIDILLFDTQIIDTSQLQIPHPGIPLRRFVLEPLVDIAPNIFHPKENCKIHDLLERCTDRSALEKLSESFPNDNSSTDGNI